MKTLNEFKKDLEGRVKALKNDMIYAHIARVQKAIECGYPDENQAMIIVDHLMRIRIYEEVIQIINGELTQ